MNDEELKNYVRRCIEKLGTVFKKEEVSYESEADFHFDLYFLLNHNKPFFWKEKSVKANTHKGFDLIVHNPQSKKDKPKIVIEIKCNHYNGEDLDYDFYKLAHYHSNLIDRVFLYCGWNEDKNKVKKDLQEVEKRLLEQIEKYP